jgi:hypothetical protein
MILCPAAALRRHRSGWPHGFAHGGVDAARDDGLYAATPFRDSLSAFKPWQESNDFTQ